MRSYLRIAFILIVLSGLACTQAGAQSSVSCFSSSAGAPMDSTDIGRFVIGTDTFGSFYSHLANPGATNSYTFNSADTTVLYVDSTYHLVVTPTMNTSNDADAKLTFFVDLNADGYYDALEMVWTAYTSAFHSYVMETDLTVPSLATMNVPAMARLIINNDIYPSSASDSACGGYTSGETMDLILMFTTPPTGVAHQRQIHTSMSYYPNPGHGQFNLNYSGTAKELQLNVVTLTGQTVLSRTYSNTGAALNQHIDLSSLPKGVYLAQTNADGVRETNKIVIE